MLLSECLDEFVLSQKIKGNSKKTIDNYVQQVNYFIDFVGNIDILSVTSELYKKYILYLSDKKSIKNHKSSENNLSSYTIKSYLTQLRAFLNYCYDEGFLTKEIKFSTYKTRKSSIVVLTNFEIKQILGYYNENTFMGCRNLLIISFMLDCGLRLNEVSNLFVNDINLNYNLIKVLGKGSKERLVPLSDETKRLFLKYCSNYNVYNNGYLFVSRTGNKLTSNGISCFVSRLKKELGFKRLHPHYFRHTFATLFLLNGGECFNLQIILGHTTLSMTQKYVHIASEMAIASQRKFSPIANL